MIEKMKLDHLEQAHALNFQLGYEISSEIFVENFKRLEKSPVDSLYVYQKDDRLIGWMHLKERQLLQVPNRLEVTALVVDETSRGRGIGKALMRFAESVARDLGLGAVVLTSNVTRIDSHKFYEAMGYENKKNSKWFIKELDGR